MNGASRQGQERRGVREALLIGMALVAGVAGLGWWATRPIPTEPRRVGITEPAAASRYVGSRSCGECHPGATAANHASGHGRTFRRASEHPLARWLDGRSVADPDNPAVEWSYTLREGELSVSRTEGDRTDREVLDYALGSGKHAVTFITRLSSEPNEVRIREHRLSYFAHDDALGITPGQKAPYPGAITHDRGRDFPPELSLKCIECHVTRLSADAGKPFDPASVMPNVDCERCHGPAGSHVEAARRGETSLTMSFGLGRWNAAEQMQLCGECHRLPSFVPKEELRPGNASLARFQPVGLMQSRCYTRSDGALSCTTCHDPHLRASRDRSGYEQTCRSCHGSGLEARPECPISPQDGCLDCHMPQVEVVRGMRFTDHWIRVLPREEVR